MDRKNRKNEIQELIETLDGLLNDARYWDLARTYGEYSKEVLSHLRQCAQVQRAGRNHT